MSGSRRVLATVLILLALLAVWALVEAVSFYTRNRTHGVIVSAGQTRRYLLYVPASSAQARFLASHAAGAFEIADPEIHPPDRIVALMVKYDALPMDLADATLVLLAEWLGHGRILSSDRRDFNTLRWKNRRPFENLLA